MFFVVLISLACLSLTYVAITVMDANRLVFSFVRNLGDFYVASENARSVRTAYSEKTNTGGSSADQLGCLGGQVVCREGETPTCTTEWTAGADGVSDLCDNDDRRPEYWTGNVGSAISSDSKTSDNDHYSRIYAVGFVGSGSEDTVLAFNDQILNHIVANANNVETDSLALPSNVDEAVVRLAASSTGADVTLYAMDKARFNSDKTVEVVAKKQGKILSFTGFLNTDGNFSDSGTPWIFRPKEYDYAINVKNASSSVLSYRIWGESGSRKLYLVPLRDDAVPTETLLPRYSFYGDEFIYRYRIGNR